MIFTAGGYVSVPLVIVGRLMKIPAWVHQLDVRPGLANKLMAPFAKRVSVTWERTAKYFSAKKTIVVGGMERSGLRIGDGNALLQSLGMSPACPTILVMGGGTGARTINETIRAIIPELPEVNVIHLTGKGKNSGVGAPGAHHHYFATEFFTHEMGDAYAAADVVVARAGMGTILEVAALGKPTIFIPIENSDQLANAKMLYNLNAAIIIDHLTPQLLRQEIDRLLKDGLLRRRLSQNISNIFPFGAEERIVEEARKII
jgi:UDP-N-acetylglucosamine--N-acetylmuramyl-(pentapeptide) pyrophosphoryl-undecaprenol N-acetylglucosamine transferase